MRTLTMTASATLLLASLAGDAAATDVPRGGAEIVIGPGSKNLILKLKNTTGVQAKDVTLTIFGVDDPPKIVTIDVDGHASDKVDDDNNGALGGANEGDQTDSTADTTCRSIFGGFDVKNNDSIDVTVQFDENLPEGAKLKVRFSTEVAGTHFDLCAAANLQPFAPANELPIGTHLANYLVRNELPMPVLEFYMITPVDRPPVAAFLSPPFEGANPLLGPDVVIFQLPVPLLPGATVEINVEFSSLPLVADSVLIVPGPALPLAGLPYGSGCAGAGGFVPELHLAGVPSAGAPVTLWIDEGLGGSQSFLFVGTSPIQVPFGGGCDLLVNPLISPLLPLSPGGPGAGSLALPLILPPATPSGLSLALQAIVIDPSTPTGLSASNGVMVALQ